MATVQERFPIGSRVRFLCDSGIDKEGDIGTVTSYGRDYFVRVNGYLSGEHPDRLERVQEAPARRPLEEAIARFPVGSKVRDTFDGEIMTVRGWSEDREGRPSLHFYRDEDETLWDVSPDRCEPYAEPETVETIGAWARGTFGADDPDPKRLALRVYEEACELAYVAGCDGRELIEVRSGVASKHFGSGMDPIYSTATKPDKVLGEASDVFITVANFPGLQAAVDLKMKTNRARKWAKGTDGAWRHV